MTNFLIDIGIPKAYAGDIAILGLMILAGIVLMFIVKKTKIGAFAFELDQEPLCNPGHIFYLNQTVRCI